jgi:hypothetical protein
LALITATNFCPCNKEKPKTTSFKQKPKTTSEHETWPQQAFSNSITGREPSDQPSWLERGDRRTPTWLRLCLLISCLLKPVTGCREMICHPTLRKVACLYYTVIARFWLSSPSRK